MGKADTGRRLPVYVMAAVVVSGALIAEVALRELADVSRRVDNAALLAALPHTAVAMATIVADVQGGRADR